jgi:RimJ/RimL family protein N-acetyltransferase
MRLDVTQFHPSDLEGFSSPFRFKRDYYNEVYQKEDYEVVSIVDQTKKVMAIAGFQLITGGVGQIWITPRSGYLSWYMTLAKTARELVDIIFEGKEIHRLQMTIEPEFERGDRWARFLGFSYEGLMKSYIKGVDVKLYGRVK